MSVVEKIVSEFQLTVQRGGLSNDELQEAYHAICRTHFKSLCEEYESVFNESVLERIKRCSHAPDAICAMVEERILSGIKFVRDEDLPPLPEGYKQEDGGIVYQADWLSE